MKTHDPGLLVSPDFTQQAAVLRHYEKHRVATQNRLYALTQFPARKDWGMHLPEDHPDVVTFTEMLALAQIAEEAQVESLTGAYLLSPLHQFTGKFKGLAPGKLVARFLGETGDPYLQTQGHLKDCKGKGCTCAETLEKEPRPRTFGQLKSYCGMAPVDGKIPANTRGEQSAFKGAARTRLWLITDQLIKQHDSTYWPVFTEGVKWYSDEAARGVSSTGKPWTDAQFEVIGRKRARVLAGVRFLEDLYSEAKLLHEAA